MAKDPNVKQRKLSFEPSIQDEFEEFIKLNPNFYKEFVSVARQIVSTRKANGREVKYLSADGIIHFMRIYAILYVESNTEYSINDHISSRIVRMLMEDKTAKDLHDYFRTRALRAA